MKWRIIATVSTMIFLAACVKRSETTATQGIPVVSVSILPQKYFVEQIAGDLVQVNVMIPTGASPATYEPSASQLARLSHSDLYMKIGYVGFEMSWMEKIQDMNPSMRMADLSKGVDLVSEDSEEHGHGHEGEHDHGGVDPHIWMSPRNARIIAGNVYRELLPLLQGKEEEMQVLYQDFITRLDSLDVALNGMLEKFEGSSFMIYHPALTYFARDYHLEQYPMELEGKSPSPAHMRRLTDVAKEKSISIIFLQMQFDQDNARTLSRETGAGIIQIDPLDPDWYGQMLFIGRTLAENLD